MLFNTNIKNEDIVRNGVEVKTDGESKLLNEYADLLKYRDGYIDKIDALAAARGTHVQIDALWDSVDAIDQKIVNLNKKLSGLFERERARLNRVQTDTAIDGLAEAYRQLQNSQVDYIKNAYDDYMYKRILSLKEEIGGTPIRDMNAVQMRALYDVYNMVLTTVRKANSLFDRNKYSYDVQMGFGDAVVSYDRCPRIKPGESIGVNIKIVGRSWEIPENLSIRFIAPDGFTVNGPRSFYMESGSIANNYMPNSNNDYIVTAGETVEAQNRIIVEVVCQGRHSVGLFEIMLLG